MDQILNYGGAVISNKALRKYFRMHYCKDARDKSYIDLADIYGQIVSQGLVFEKEGKLKGEDEYFYTDADYIADELCLPVRRVRDLISVLVEVGLLDKKSIPGKPNRYAPCPTKLEELVKDITFEYRELRKIKKYKDKYGGNYKIRMVYNTEKRKYEEILYDDSEGVIF